VHIINNSRKQEIPLNPTVDWRDPGLPSS